MFDLKVIGRLGLETFHFGAEHEILAFHHAANRFVDFFPDLRVMPLQIERRKGFLSMDASPLNWDGGMKRGRLDYSFKNEL